jgi:CIC family chloride channel protein
MWRRSANEQISPWIALPIIGIAGGLLSGWLIEKVAPEASGSGIPQVKAALGYAPIALDLRVAAVKLVSTSLSLGSGLALGRQGPTVQIGAALAAQLSHWTATSPAYRRQLVAAGAAAGLAAGFNAPIAGVLFAIEELLQDLSDVTLGTAILAAFVGGVVSRLLGGRGLIPELDGIDTSFHLIDIPFLLVLGLTAGLLGGLLSRGILASLSVNRHLLRTWTLSWRMALAGGMTGVILAALPPLLRRSSELQDALVLGGMDWQLKALALVTQFGLIAIAYGSGAPGGLFAPCLILGSALGGLVVQGAMGLQNLGGLPANLALSSPTIYALTGMGAFFSAVTRGPITAIVIVFEMTADFNLVLPLMIGSITSSLVAQEVFKGSIYQHLLELRGIYLGNSDPSDRRWSELKAADIMERRVETLPSQMTIREAIQTFAKSHHRGFPVVAQGKLVGIISQSDLAQITQQRIDGELPLSQIMNHKLITVNPTDSLTHVLHCLNRYQISRLPVTEGRKLVGIITRADIIRAESDRVAGETNPLGTKPEPSYVVYQTQAPATGQGRLLVPLSNPKTIDALMQIAVAIAKDRNYEIECIQAIVLPSHLNARETQVDTVQSRQLLAIATRYEQKYQISIHTQIRVTHNTSHAILEAIQERHINLLLMGWQGHTSTPGRIFGDVADTAIRQAPCDVILVKLGIKSLRLNRWLVPMAGGPNARYAIGLLPALVTLSQNPEINLCQVFHPSEPYQKPTLLTQEAKYLKKQTSCAVNSISLCATSVAEAALDLTEKQQCDAILLGASRESMLQQVIQGNIPEAIARNCNCTVILVRKAE